MRHHEEVDKAQTGIVVQAGRLLDAVHCGRVPDVGRDDDGTRRFANVELSLVDLADQQFVSAGSAQLLQQVERVAAHDEDEVVALEGAPHGLVGGSGHVDRVHAQVHAAQRPSAHAGEEPPALDAACRGDVGDGFALEVGFDLPKEARDALKQGNEKQFLHKTVLSRLT